MFYILMSLLSLITVRNFILVPTRSFHRVRIQKLSLLLLLMVWPICFISYGLKLLKKENDYTGFEVKWNDVPGRDEKWREETIARTSERQFMQEFENKFLGGANTLIGGDALLALQSKEPIFTNDQVRIFTKPEKGHDYVITSDVSEGVGGDSSTFSVIDVTVRPFDQVATFSDNKISPHLFAELLVKYAKMYNNAYLWH